MSVIQEEDRLRWLISAGEMSYGLEVDEHGVLRSLHFGGDVRRVQDLPGFEDNASVTGASFDSLDAARTEYPAWSGLYYAEPCLKATFHDGVRDVWLRYESHETGADRLTITLRDAHYPLRVRLRYRAQEEHGVLLRWAEIENTGDESIYLDTALSAALHPPLAAATCYWLTHLAGRWGAETRVFRQALTPGRNVLESRRGNTSHEANPWFAVDAGGATEEAGEAWFGALAWSGNWKLAFDQDAAGALQISGGINDFDFRWLLEPGETFETPALVAGYTSHGFGGASRTLHRYAREIVMPEDSLRPVLYNSWEATYFDVDYDGQARLAEKAAAIGVELFVVDDGWFGARDHDRAGLGDWFVNEHKFPEGLGPLIQHVKSLGMQFGLWVEPEMVNPDSDLYRAHPDWVYHFPTRLRTEARNQLVLNLGRDDVREYLFESLDRLLSENDVSFVKWDMNRPFSEPGWPGAPAGRDREVWVRHVRSLYELLGRLRERHPQVDFESCSGGGGRVDLGILGLAEQVWTSDNTDPHDRLFVQEGFSMAYPARAMTCWVADAEKWVANRPAPLTYRFHSAMMGTLGIGGALLSWSEDEMAEARGLVEDYKRVRHLVQDGDQHRLLSPAEGETTAVQYVAADGSEAVIFVLRHPHNVLMPASRLYPRGLTEEATYQVSGEEGNVSGAALMTRGIGVVLDGDLASAMIELREVD